MAGQRLLNGEFTEGEVKYSVVGKRGHEVRGDLLVCGVTEEGVTGPLLRLDDMAGGLVSRVLDSREIEGKLLESSLLNVREEFGSPRLLLVGLGKASDMDHEVLRQAGGKAATAAREIGASKLVIDLETFRHFPGDRTAVAASLAEGAGLSIYRFQKHKSEVSGEKKPPSLLEIAAGKTARIEGVRRRLARTSVIVESTNLARDLANEPANALTPTRFARIARDIARTRGMKCKVLGREEMKKLGMGGVLAVSAGSNEPPQFIILEHRGRAKRAPTIALVGKGITFDSGGISIKPAEKMDEMKFDKAGACSVLGTMNAVALLGLPLHVIGLMPLSENLLGGSAYRPGDVVKMHSGKTVEVISTDAEGRLLVADALSFAQGYSPDALIDLATLTGACVIALGSHATGLVGNDPDLAEKVKAAGERTGERVWEFPSWKEYREQLKSEIADLKNVGGREAGAITAGLFLKEFVGGRPWVHLDIAGTAWVVKDFPYKPRGACGTGVRLLVELLTHWGAKAPLRHT